ncbi:anthranilate synthase component I [mine drainage metagenome]|uniref:Anthranilate synthase component I n=1 Tax=mine drainage metagenome TaxID=410659 RepID=T1AQU5_9ZZZZ
MVREVFSDLDTPLSVYLKLADGPHTFLFESVEGGEAWGRYSIIGLPARRVYTLRAGVLETSDLGEVIARDTPADPLAAIEQLRASFKVPRLPGLPAFTGGLVGYFGFECIGYIEPRLLRADKPDLLGTPDALLMLADEVAVFDNLRGRLFLIVHADPAQPQAWRRAVRRLDELAFRLRRAGSAYPETLRPQAAGRGRFQIQFQPRRIRGAGRTRQGIHPCRRYFPGGALAAPERAL